MFRWTYVPYVPLLWILAGSGAASLQTSSTSPHKPAFSTGQFKLLTRPRDFALQFVSNGKTRQISVPRDWLIPPEEEKTEARNYVYSFTYGKEVISFPIGNGQIGLRLSGFGMELRGSAHAGAGRDVFLIFDPKSLAVTQGGIQRGITKQQLRAEGCFSATVEHYFIADVDGDGLTDIGVVREELQCIEKSDGWMAGCESPKSDPLAESVTCPPAPSWPIIASQSCRLVHVQVPLEFLLLAGHVLRVSTLISGLSFALYTNQWACSSARTFDPG